jgi:putative ABC transport system permease protein
MLRNYIKTAWRNLWKNKFYASINIAGLAIGLAVGLIILLWVNDEKSYDRFHSKQEEIYRVVPEVGSGESLQSWAHAPAPIATYGKQTIPGVKEAVRIALNYDYSFYSWNNKKFSSLSGVYVDSSFFSLFDFPIIDGLRTHPFPDNNSVLITKKTAATIFGKEDPIGKVISADNKTNFIVRGVIADFPSNSSIQADMLFPMKILETSFQPDDYWKSFNEDWGDFMFETYFQVEPNTSIAGIEQKLKELHTKNNKHGNALYHLRPISSIHLYGLDGKSGNAQMVNIFMGVAILLLLIACINYVNLSTARAMLRAREVSVRKIVGAGKAQLFFQFIAETLILFLIATVLATSLIKLLMPLYNSISGKNNEFELWNTSVLSTIGITIAGTLIASSIYPALLLSSFKPILALKGKISNGIGNAGFRKVLVVAQFSFAVMLIISTLIIGKQLSFLRSKELGYDRSHMFYFNMNEAGKHYDAIRTELLQQPGVLGITAASANLTNVNNTTSDTDWDGKPQNMDFLIHPVRVDNNFFSTMKMQLTLGKGFTGLPSDTSGVVLNETAILNAGIKDPIGKSFTLWQKKATIVGVVKDFHYTSLKREIEPAVFYIRATAPHLMYIRTNGKDAAKAIAAAAAAFKKYNGDWPFEYKFLDETYDRLYRADQRTGKLFNIFAVIAILISCLGLFGLATYTTQVKTREIGIRKVLGASVAGVTGMLAKDFVKLVAIAVIIASPMAWYAMHHWLQDFAYRTSIGAWVFLLAGFIAILIALITVSSQAIRAALANPVKSLKTE